MFLFRQTALKTAPLRIDFKTPNRVRDMAKTTRPSRISEMGRAAWRSARGGDEKRSKEREWVLLRMVWRGLRLEAGQPRGSEPITPCLIIEHILHTLCLVGCTPSEQLRAARPRPSTQDNFDISPLPPQRLRACSSKPKEPPPPTFF